MAKTTHSRETVYSDTDPTHNLLRGTEPGTPRGVFAVRQNGDRLQALICSRWCNVARLADGRLVEVWGAR